MAHTMQTYSSFFHCLHDHPETANGHYGAYSVFRAIDSRDIEQQPAPLPCIHDFAVIWDDDHDTRIIAVLEEMLMAGLLPGVQFVGEHKGTLTVILAARTYWKIDIKDYVRRVEALTVAAGDYWNVRLGMFDHSPGNIRSGHQCDFQEIIGLSDEALHAFLFSLDHMWQLGTKKWTSVDVADPPSAGGPFFAHGDRYRMRRPRPGPR